MSVPPGTDIGRYRIVKEVGATAGTVLHKAYDTVADRFVLLRTLARDDQATAERARETVRAIASLTHPNILSVIDLGEDRGVLYVISEFVDGEPLARRLGEPMSPASAIDILRPIGSALDHAHERGVLHRALTPDSILVDRAGAPVVHDFGLREMVGTLPRLTTTGALVGDPDYMSPEEAAGESASAASDRYALAVIAYEMLTGQVPYHADTPLATLLAHLHRPVPDARRLNPSLSGAVEAVLRRGLAKTPDERYRTASNLVEALEEGARAPQAPAPAPGAEEVDEATQRVPHASGARGRLTLRAGGSGSFELVQRDYSIGRSRGNDILLRDPSVSARHARLTARGSTYLIHDLGSTNGTRVNGTEIAEDRALAPGDLIALGEAVLLFEQSSLSEEGRGAVRER